MDQVSSKSECRFQRYPWSGHTDRRQTTHAIRDRDHHIVPGGLRPSGTKILWTKFHQNPSAGSKDIKGLDRHTHTDRQTDTPYAIAAITVPGSLRSSGTKIIVLKWCRIGCGYDLFVMLLQSGNRGYNDPSSSGGWTFFKLYYQTY